MLPVWFEKGYQSTSHDYNVFQQDGAPAHTAKVVQDWLKENMTKGYQSTSHDYKEILDRKVLPWVRKITKNADYVFQQDGTPAHTAKVVQEPQLVEGKHDILVKRFLASTVT